MLKRVLLAQVVENKAARAFPAEGERAPTRAPLTTTGRAARLREGQEEEGKGDGAVSSRSHKERRLETTSRGGGARTSRSLRAQTGHRGRSAWYEVIQTACVEVEHSPAKRFGGRGQGKMKGRKERSKESGPGDLMHWVAGDKES